MNSKVSVIIPTYKSWLLLEKCLDALQRQTYQDNIEILVINNDIHEDVPRGLLHYKNVKFLSEEKPGSYAARNKGLEFATGEILAFTDADCIPQNTWLENGIKTLLDTNAGIVGGQVKIFYRDPNNPTAAEIYDSYTGFNQKGYVAQGHCITANWFSFKKVICEFGGFNSELKSNGDSELSGKISKVYPVIYSEEALVLHPARYTINEIIVKYKRLMGGTYDRRYRNSELKFKKYLYNFIFRRLRFNVNLFLKLKIYDAIKILYVHLHLFPAIVKEYYSIVKTGQTERL